MATKYTRGPNWKRQRKAARLRDNNTCQHCTTTDGVMTVNHIRPFRLFSDYREANRLENLETLCPPCHVKADMAFWQANADLLPSRTLPDCEARRDCDRCGVEYYPRSGASKLCDPCHTYVCQNCGVTFVSKRAALRVVKYCSMPCQFEGRGKTGWRNRIKQCLQCGGDFTAKHKETRYCSQACHVRHDPPDQYRRLIAAARTRAAQASGPTAAEGLAS